MGESFPRPWRSVGRQAHPRGMLGEQNQLWASGKYFIPASKAKASMSSENTEWKYLLCSWFFLIKILFIFREGKEGRKRGREISMCGCLSHALYWGLGPQTRHVPWLGIERVTLRLAGWCSIHWATPARGFFFFFFLRVDYVFPKDVDWWRWSNRRNCFLSLLSSEVIWWLPAMAETPPCPQ